LRRRTSTTALSLVTIGALSLAAGCGSSSSGGENPTVGATNPSSASASLNSAAAAKLPAALKSAGVVKVAADASYAPNEFFDTDNKTVIGMDVDLAHAIGTELGVKFDVVNEAFDSIIPSLGNRFDLGMSSFTDNKDREKKVTMVDYFSAGTSFMVKKGSTLNPSSVADLCGKKAAVEKGTTQLDDVTAQSKKCKLTILPFPDQNGANLALQSGRADVVLADSPVNAYAAKQSNGNFAIVGQVYGTAPYGIAVPKAAKYAGFADAILAALQDLSQKGVYQQILQKWGVQAGAITDFKENGAAA
jgi:polar amino acid transport system substrate-binding protein